MTLSPTLTLRDAGQSLWLDNITRDLLDQRHAQALHRRASVTGLTSNPTIFDKAISKSTDYDAAIEQKLARGQVGRGSCSSSWRSRT